MERVRGRDADDRARRPAAEPERHRRGSADLAMSFRNFSGPAQLAAHNKGCACAGCCGPSKAGSLALTPAAGAAAQLVAVVQRTWTCSDCGYTGDGKASEKGKCPDCGKKGTQVEVKAKQSFGVWFDSLPAERRQALLREHGSHEANGGVLLDNQGGGGKGNQHSNGVANAKKQIKAKYDAGEYD